MRTSVPEWVVNFTWFIAGIGATGAFWYFLGAGNVTVALWIAFATFWAVVLAIIMQRRNGTLAKEAFLNSLFFRQLDIVFVEVSHGMYQVGLIVHVLNEDGTRALRFNGVTFEGRYMLRAATGGFHIKSLAVHEDKVQITGKYYLSPGEETSLYMLLPAEFEMTLEPGGVPQLQFAGNVTFAFGSTTYPSQPRSLVTIGIKTLEEWHQLAKW